MGNELVAEVKESETVWSGSRLIEDGFDLKEAFESKSWVSGGLAVAATAADTAAAVMDPLGEALSTGIGWIIEHLSPLKDWLNELAGDSDAVAAAASTWTNIGTKLNSCATSLDTVCSSRLAGQESLAVATFKTLQAGSASHLRMTGEVAGAISGGLTLASMIVRMVHDMVRDAIADVIGKLTSKAAIMAVSLGTAAPWAVSSVAADVSSWVTRLSKEVADVVLSSKNLKKLLDKAENLFSRLGKKWESFKASRAEKKAAKKKAAENPADDTKNADNATDGAKSTSHATDTATDGAKNANHATDAAAEGAASAAGAAATSAKRASHAADKATDTAKHTDEATEAATAAKTKSEPVDEYADRGDGRDIKGRYAKGNGGAHTYDDSEALGLERYTNDLSREGVAVKEVIEYKRLARIEGAPQGRYYDRLVQREDGTWVGLEVKSGGSSYSGTQRAADNMVSPDNPAIVKLDDGRTIKVTEIHVERVPKQ